MFMSFDVIFSSLTSRLNQEVSIHGCVVVRGLEESFICADRDGYVHGECIPVLDGGRIAKELFDQVPAYGGGICMFKEECWVTGTIRAAAKAICLADLTYCRVLREKWDITIDFRRPFVSRGPRDFD